MDVVSRSDRRGYGSGGTWSERCGAASDGRTARGGSAGAHARLVSLISCSSGVSLALFLMYVEATTGFPVLSFWDEDVSQ